MARASAMPAVAALLSAGDARAACDEARAVALVVDGGGDAALQRSVERHVATELRSGAIGICAEPPGARQADTQRSTEPGSTQQPRQPGGLLASVFIRTPAPERPLASIRVSRAGADPLERELDVAGLPPETRALAIATAADELVRAALAGPDPAEVGSAASAPAPAEPAATPAADRGALEQASREGGRAPQARFELGVAGTASSVFGQREALGADVTGRYWLTPRIALDASVGLARRVSRPFDRGSVQPAHDLHAGLGAAHELWRDDVGLGLVARAGLELGRVGFDEQLGGGALTAEAVGAFVAFPAYSLDSSWWLSGRVGLEGRYRAGPIGLGVALNAIVPVVPAESDWGDTTSLDRLGIALAAGVWLPLGTSE